MDSGYKLSINTFDSATLLRIPYSQNKLARYTSISRVNGSTNSTGLNYTILEDEYMRGSCFIYADDTNIYVGDRIGVTTAYQDFIARAGYVYSYIAYKL